MIFCWILFLAAGAWAGGDHVKNGGGIAEQRILFAYQNLERFIDLCLRSDSCQLSADQRAILDKVLKALPSERAGAGGATGSGQIQFAKGSEHSEIFVIDGVMRVAVTGDAIGSLIYINQELIYGKDSQGIVRAISFGEAVALLVHELGHHHGIKDHTWLDFLGARLRGVVEAETQRTNIEAGNIYFSMTWINFSLHSITPLFVMDRENSLDVTAAILKQIKCADSQDRLTGLWLWNVRWNLDPGAMALAEIRLICTSTGGISRPDRMFGEYLEFDFPMTGTNGMNSKLNPLGEIKVRLKTRNP